MNRPIWLIILEWVMSFSSVLVLFLYGRKWRYAPVLGLVNQVFWLGYTFLSGQFGMFANTIVYTIVHGWNMYKWIREK